VFCQLLMADEINRASPPTHSALLQAVQEHRVAIGGVELAGIAYFLPDRSVRVFAGPPDGTFGDQSVEPKSCGYDFVINPAAPDGDFMLVYTEPTTGLRVFKRAGAPCRPADY
jgi:hypothetical protein